LNKEEKKFGYCDQDAIIQCGWGHYPDREIGKVKENDVEASILYFEERFNDKKLKVSELIQKVSQTTNKGSFLIKFIHLRDTLHQHDGIGNYLELYNQIASTISLIEEIIEGNRKKNTEIKQALIGEIKEVVELVNWKEATEKVLAIKEKWIKTGSAKQELQKEMESVFWESIKSFYERKHAFYEDKKRLSLFYETKYKELVTEALKLKEYDNGKIGDKIEALKERWKTNGPVPSEMYTQLLKEFNRAIKPPSNFRVHSNLPELLKQLESLNLQKRDITSVEIEQIQNTLKNIRTANPEERKTKDLCNSIIFLINERTFLNSICVKKFKNFNDKSIVEQNQIKSQIIKELIERDTNELKLIELNQENFNVTNPKVHEMMEKKLHFQKHKIATKQKILLELLLENKP